MNRHAEAGARQIATICPSLTPEQMRELTGILTELLADERQRCLKVAEDWSMHLRTAGVFCSLHNRLVQCVAHEEITEKLRKLQE